MFHIILILPLIGLVVFLIFPFDIAAPIYAVILFSSVKMYISILRSMKEPVVTGKEEMIHENVEVLDIIKPKGHVRFHNEIWKAYSDDSLKKGDRAEIIGINGLTLIVRKLNFYQA